MGKNLTQQKRGKGSATYRSPSFRYAGKAMHPNLDNKKIQGYIEDFIHCQGHSAPLMVVRYEEEYNLMIAPEGKRIGESVSFGKGSDVAAGNTLPLSDIPEGTKVFGQHVYGYIPGPEGSCVMYRKHYFPQ